MGTQKALVQCHHPLGCVFESCVEQQMGVGGWGVWGKLSSEARGPATAVLLPLANFSPTVHPWWLSHTPGVLQAW